MRYGGLGKIGTMIRKPFTLMIIWRKQLKYNREDSLKELILLLYYIRLVNLSSLLCWNYEESMWVSDEEITEETSCKIKICIVVCDYHIQIWLWFG